MAEEERVPLSEKDDTQSNDTTQSKDAYVPEEPTPDTSICLSDIQMPETPESTKGQISDGDTSRLESPKAVKPVLGKIQAKKRLMAFANQFKVLSKSQIKSNSQHSTGVLKTKDKTTQDDTNTNKSRKKTEEKILAIEEIRREESKSKMLAMASMAAASMEDENHTGKNISDLLESKKHGKRSKYEGINESRKNRSTINRKYSERHRHRDKTDRGSSNREVKDRNESTEHSTQKSSQDRDTRKKDKKRKEDKDKRDDSKADISRDKREEEKDKKENEKEKREEIKEKREGTKSKKENTKDKRNNMLGMEAEGKDKKEKDKDRLKEKELSKCKSWMELQKSGLTLDDINHLRRRENTERSVRNRTAQDYARHLEHMLMLNNHHLKRQALIVEGLDGPKKYPPESIKTTKRAKGAQLLYCENPRTSLFLCTSQLLQAVSPERRQKIRDICEASSSQFDTEDITPQMRNWYQQINATKYHKDTKWQVTVQLPKSKWDSEDEEITSVSAKKEEIEKPINKLHISVVQQERCSTSSSTIDEDKVDTNAEDIKEDNESSEKTIDNTTTNDEASKSPLQSTGDEKLASEYEQFMKMVCTVTDVTKEYLPKKNIAKTASPHSYHEFNIESNLAEDNTDIEIPLKEKKDKTLEESIKSTECEESTISTDCQIQINDENNMQIEHTNSIDESEDSKSIPSDWENVRIKVERLSDENTESREIKKKKKQKKVMSSSDSSSSTSSSDSEKEKKRKKRKRKILSNSSSSDSDSTDSSSSSSSDSSSSDEKRKRRRKKKTVGKKKKKAKRARTKKKRRRKMITDSSSSDSDQPDQRIKKKKKVKKKKKEAKSINNGDISKIISKSPASSSGETKILHSETSIKKVKEETMVKNKKITDEITSTRKTITSMNVHDNECMKQWEVDSMITLQSNDGESSQDHTGELGKIDGSEKSTHRRKRKRSRDMQDKDRSSKEKIQEGKERSDEELDVKRKKRREKDIRSSTEFLADWEREGERINQQIIQNEVKFSKKLEKKQKKEKWGETDFDTLNVPSLTQLEKEVCQKQLLADEWEVDSLEAIAITDLTVSKRKSNQSILKKMEKEVRYDEKTDTYIAIEKESAKEMKKRQERLCAIRIWEEEQEEGEKEEMMLLKQKNKHKKDDWDIEEESFLCKNNEEIEICNDIVGIEKEWIKSSDDTSVKEDSNKEIKLESIGSKRVRKSRWDMGSHSEEKSETKDIWEEEYPEWSKINKYEQKHEETEKEDSHIATYSENSNKERSVKSDLIDFYHKKSQNRESLERTWTAEEMATRPMQTKNVEDTSVKNLISVKTSNEQIVSTKEHQARDQFKEMLDLKKLTEKTIELYSPSSPALSQKSQDIEGSNDSSSSISLPCKKRRKEMLTATEELSIHTAGIPLQLTKLRDTKHVTKEKIEDILDKVQLEDKSSVHKFDIKKTDSLFDGLSINVLCSEAHSQSVCMDIFAEYGSEGSRSKQRVKNSSISSATHIKDDETNTEKTALKLIPKQLLIRRTNEQIKPTKRILEAPLQDPVQHAAALLTIQKKLLESHVLESDIQKLPNEESVDQFKSTYNAESNNKVDKLLDTTEFAVASKSSIIAIRQSPVSEKPISVRSGQSENYNNKESKSDDVKKYKTSRNLSDINVPSDVRSPREHRKRSPSKKQSEKRYSHDYSKDKKERRSDDGEKSDKRDNKSFKTDFADSRRKSSPSRGKRKRSGSPYASWERQGSGSRSPGHSWSRSRSKSPKRKDEATTSMRDREKKREMRYDDERSNRSRTDERRERYMRSSPRSYNEDNFKKHGSISSKGNREDWGRKRYDNMDIDREKDVRSYDPMELLRERTMESEKYRDNRFHTEELGHAFWQYENNNILRDGNESVDSYATGQDLPAECDDRTYYGEESLERDMTQCSPQSLPKYRRSQGRSRRDWQWEKDKDSISDRYGHRLRNRTPPRSRYSPMRQERFRRKSKSRSRSWSQSRSRTRSRSRSRSTSRSRPRMRSRSRSRSRSPLDLRSRARSISMSRLRSQERGLRMSELRSSRSPSPGRSRLNEISRERKDDDENRKLCGERGRRIETIVQSGVASGTNILDSEMGISGNMDAANFQYLNEIEGGNEYYYTENNLTYPPCIDESTTSSPKRLSLDDRLELELGIKKQHNKESTGVSSDYSNFNPNVIAYPSPPQQQQQQMMYRQQPTVLQVGNVLQVVPADFNGIQSSRREVPAVCTTPPVRSGSSQVVRVGNVLQVVPTSLDWSGGQSTTADQSNGLLYSSAVPTPSPSASSVPMSSVPVPVPVPLPVPPTGTNTLTPVPTVAPTAPLQLPLPIPVPVPVPIPPAAATVFPRNEIQSQKIVQPVYNYEAILETRRKEREERKRLRELRRKEKERKRIERINRRALRLLEQNNISRPAGEILLDRRKGSVVDPSVLKALKEGEEQAEAESPSQNNSIKEEEEEVTASIKEEDEDAAADEDEDDDEDEAEAEAEDDEEEEEEAEDEDEDDNDDDEKSSQMINQRTEVDEVTMPADMNKDQAEIETIKEWPELPPPPLKGILIAPGFRRDSIPNGNLDDLADTDDDIKSNSDNDEEVDKNNECNKDMGLDAKSGKSARLLKKINKKSVQFADGIKPGEGTSPSGGEGDMPSPPPPKRIDLREGLKDLRKDKIYSSRKSRKQEKRTRLPKTKKKVKVKIIKLKKPRVTPLTAMMMDDSDEMDDRSPPPPPPGSPPPPHLWPSYLSVYNTTVRTIEQPQTTTPTLTSVQAPPPPTPLPLLVPPPPLNYTIQPCSKA